MNIAQRAVDERTIYGRWRVEARVAGSTRKVVARCLDCDTCHEVDLYGLRRKDRRNERCQACSNRLISASNKLPPREALLRGQYHEYRKNAAKRGILWSINSDHFRVLVQSNCHYCGVEPNRRVESSWDSILMNGIDRLDSSDYYRPGNVVTCCKDCNYAKRSMSASDFLNLCRRVVRHNDCGNDRT